MTTQQPDLLNAPDAEPAAEPAAALPPAPPPTDEPLPDPLPITDPAAQLAQRILDLGDAPARPPSPWRSHAGPLGTARELLTRLDVPQAAHHSLASYGAKRRSASFKLSEDGPELTLSFTYRDGSWEEPAGNSQPNFDPDVVGVELSAQGAIALMSPAHAQRFARPESAKDAASPPEVFAVWERTNYLATGTVAHPRWYVARFEHRAPFHYTEQERAALEQMMIRLTQALNRGDFDVSAWMAEHYADKRVEEGKPLYDFGAGLVNASHPSGISIKFVDLMRFPKLFEAHNLTLIKTSFAHDFGEMASPLVGPGFQIGLGGYVLGDKEFEAHRHEMGDPRTARFYGLSIAVKPPKR